MAGLRKLLPREPSVAGMILLSGIVGLMFSRPPLPYLFLALLALLTHLVSFDAAFSLARSRRFGRLAAIGAVNTAPYLISLLTGGMPLRFLASAGFIMAAYGSMYMLYGPHSAITYIVGASIPVLPALTLSSIAGPPPRPALLFWILLTIYNIATTAYVETLLPWRNMNRLIPLLIWLPAPLISAVAEPTTLIAAVEPTVKFALNVPSRLKVNPTAEELRRLGWREMRRLMLYTMLLSILLALAP